MVSTVEARCSDLTSLYRAFDAAGTLLYVGISGSWTRRLNEHAKEKGWWANVAQVTVENFADRHTALAAEESAIKRERPKHNLVHAPERRRGRRIYPRSELMWCCDSCGVGLADRGRHSGWVQVEVISHSERTWCVHHRECDPLGDGAGYCIEVDRINTQKTLDDWFDHLEHKRWFDAEDWWRMVERCCKPSPA